MLLLLLFWYYYYTSGHLHVYGVDFLPCYFCDGLLGDYSGHACLWTWGVHLIIFIGMANSAIESGAVSKELK